MNSGIRDMLRNGGFGTGQVCFCSVQSVNFRHYLLGNRGVQALWPLLRYGRALKSLNLAENDIHNTGMQYILKCLEEDAAGKGKDDVGGLVCIDLSRNPFTGAIAPDITQFNEARKDVLMLGLRDTNLPAVRRQKILRQTLTKFASAEPHLQLESWQLAREPADFLDRELFIQAERIVEGTSGQAIHDMRDNSEHSNQWGEDDSWGGSRRDSYECPDGFAGLDDDLASLDGFGGNPDGFAGLDEPDAYSTVGQFDGARGTPFSDATVTTMPCTPTPPPPRNPFECKANASDSRRRKSWAVRRRQLLPKPPPAEPTRRLSLEIQQGRTASHAFADGFMRQRSCESPGPMQRSCESPGPMQRSCESPAPQRSCESPASPLMM
jgi:hypothetical protein